MAAATVAMGLTVTGPSVGASPSTPAASAGEVDAPIPDIDWEPCQDGLECAKVAVPRDYDDPNGPTIQLRLVKVPAGDPNHRIGTVFVNPGGPGGSSANYAPYAAERLGTDVRQRFDVVGIDPRGVGGSSEARCQGDAEPPPEPQVAFPYTERQVKVWLRYDRYYRNLCATGGNAIIDHLSTADTARDMDLIRQALGEDKLSYYGASYGTYLGATYAAMFPDRIRAMIVDGVLDPIAWATGRGDEGTTVPFSARVRSHQGGFEALMTAFAECDRVGKQRCALAGDAAHKWLRIVHRLKRGPVIVDGERLNYPNWVNTALGGLWDGANYVALMQYIQAAYVEIFGSSQARQRADSSAARDHLRELVEQGGPVGPYAAEDVVLPAFHAISCSDSVNPSDPRAWIEAGKIADRQGPWFGRLWTWESSPCARWPGSSADAFRGPFGVETSAPVLVIGNSHDPATPISGARVLNSLLRGSRLLTMDGWGHGALDTSDCVTGWMQRYLVSVELPGYGTVCEPNQEIFPKRS